MKIKKVRLALILWTVICLIIIFCVVPTDSVEDEFRIIPGTVPDTISPWDSVAVVFSQPLSDTLVLFTFFPPFYMYSLRMSETRDTIHLHFAEPLDGDTRYVIRLEEKVTSSGGAVLEPSDDSVVVVTASVEQEPNGTVSLADTLTGRCFGSAGTVNDTDCFLISGEETECVYLVSHGSQTSFIFQDDEGTRSEERLFNESDTTPVPEDAAWPLYVIVFSYHRSVGGYYELGNISPDSRP
jgi:hypothetical protein